MALLVACSGCDRKYKAAADKLGKRFRCHCGQVLEVKDAKGQESAVIRCSSCGGAREKGRNRCGYCDADFTIHERDLNTVCPKCLTRVSGKSKFCRHCGTRLSGETIVPESSLLTCPLCGPKRRLSDRKLGSEQISALECSFCAGLWLGTEAFQQLRRRALDAATAERDFQRLKPPPSQLKRHIGPRYRSCIYCGEMMSRQQYARGSGVVIDLCREHGIWFDAEELQQILDWIARGGMRLKPLTPAGTPTRRPGASRPDNAKRRSPVRQAGPKPRASASNDVGQDAVGDLLLALASWLR